MIRLAIYILALLVYSEPHAAVVVSSATLTDGVVTIGGSGFGSKTTAAPVYNQNWDSMTTGSTPTGWTVESGTPTVETTKSYSGDNSVKFVNTSDTFQQLSKDMGASDFFIFRGKIHLDDTLNTMTSGQWKGIRFSSSNPPYGINQEATTAIVLFDSWWDDTPQWYNNGSPYFYSEGTNQFSLSAPSTFFPWSEWFDFTFIVKRSSEEDTADGEVFNIINGATLSSSTSVITHGESTSGTWRYMLMGGTIDGAGDNETINIYYDDFYVDDTMARVEVCVGSTWSARGKCDPQPATSWSTTSISATYSAPSDGDYIYVVDEAGLVNSSGISVTAGVGQSFSGSCSITMRD